MTMTAKALIERLRASLVKPSDDMPGGMFMTEVALNGRRIDGLYCGFFGSRGKYLRGYEVKVARSDWLAELDQPAKAEEWEQNVHEWWIVAPDTTIVRPEELPHGWGLIVPDPNPRTKTRMLVVVKATRYEDRNPSWKATHAIIQKADTERMRATADRVKAARIEIHKQLSEAYESRAQQEEGVSPAWQRRAERAERLLEETASILGVSIVDGERSYGLGSMTIAELRASYGRFIEADRVLERHLQHNRQQLERLLTGATEAREALEAMGMRR